ncbi:MAG: cupin domain-containing protein [bacterium]
MKKSNFLKQVISLENSIDYQQNAIVSQTIISKGNNSVTLFAFDEGEEIAGHSAPVDAIVQAIKGEVEITISGEKFDLKEGDVIIMPAGEPHALLAKTKFKMMLIKL